MYDELTEQDIKKMEDEIEYRKLSGEDDQDSEDHIHGLRGGRSRNE